MSAVRPILQVEGLGRRFGDRFAVRDLSFCIDAPMAVGLLGSNGAGKSTTLRLCAGWLTPDTGRALVCGHDVGRSPPAARANLGYLAEGSPLCADLRVESYLRFRARLKGLPQRAAAIAASTVMERCDLTHERRTLCGQLSRGFRQRVGIADALLRVLVHARPRHGALS